MNQSMKAVLYSSSLSIHVVFLSIKTSKLLLAGWNTGELENEVLERTTLDSVLQPAYQIDHAVRSTIGHDIDD